MIVIGVVESDGCGDGGKILSDSFNNSHLE